MNLYDLSDVHWTVIGRGPSGSKALVCTHRDCGHLHTGDFETCLGEAKKHSHEHPLHMGTADEYFERLQAKRDVEQRGFGP